MHAVITPDARLLLQGVTGPLQIDDARWERILRLARMSGLHGRLAAVNASNPTLTEPVRRHLTSAARVAAHRTQMLHAELAALAALCTDDFPVVVLKGGAYLLQEQAIAVGRFVSDVDLLVPRDHLRTMEHRLRSAGWTSAPLHAYDERYYRDWSHETPPMRFPGRLLEVDLHHAITPVTGSLHFDPQPLFEASEPLPGSPLRTLSHEDQVLHACLHCFHDGDLGLRLREVVDIDGLLRTFAERPGFWERLVRRALKLGVHRPLWYALHFAAEWLQHPVPRHAMDVLPVPSNSARRWMDALVPLAMLPSDPDHPVPPLVAFARTAMLTRYHLLRMPPRLLIPHLIRKTWRRLRARHENASPEGDAGQA